MFRRKCGATYLMTDEHHDHQAAPYMAIFGLLIVCTILSALADVLELNLPSAFLIFIVLVIATIKAMFVMMFFMHLKFEGKWKYVILLPTAVLALAMPFALASDIAVHYYDVAVPQENTLLDKEVLAEEQADDHQSHDGHKNGEHGGSH